MVAYRAMAYIPTRAILPGDVDVSTAPDAEVVRALKNLAHFPADMLGHSGGMFTVDLSIRVLTDILPETMYSEVEGSEILAPSSVANHVGEFGEYDLFIVANPSTLTTATTFRGVGGTVTSTPYAWVKIGSDERAILCHEFAHAMTAYLGTVTAEYSNFPECGVGIPAVHCGVEYGFIDDLDPLWLDGFFQGTLDDDTGINATGWAFDSPTDRGAKVPSTYRERPAPWGRLGPLRIS